MISPLTELNDGLSRLDGPWRQAASDIADTCAALDTPFALRAVLLCLRDMPFHRPLRENSVAASLAEWRGTCSAKHLAVYDLLRRLDLTPKFWMARYLIPPDFPGCSETLRAALRRTDVHDVHNYVTCDLGRGDVLIDVTFPQALAPHGFVVTADWTGDGDFALACTPLETREIAAPADALNAKREWLRALNIGPAAELREEVIQSISALMDRIAPPRERRAALMDTLRTLAHRRPA